MQNDPAIDEILKSRREQRDLNRQLQERVAAAQQKLTGAGPAVPWPNPITQVHDEVEAAIRDADRIRSALIENRNSQQQLKRQIEEQLAREALQRNIVVFGVIGVAILLFWLFS